MITELGELLDIHKKHVYYGREIDLLHVEEEIGDFAWYAAVWYDLCSETGPIQKPIGSILPVCGVIRAMKYVLAGEVDDAVLEVMAYCKDMGLDWQVCLNKNIKKLKQRYPEKFSLEASNNRDVDAEYAAMDNDQTEPPT
jgi:NTP pyrophosphatase (non-canonical NTP hydrolase)